MRLLFAVALAVPLCGAGAKPHSIEELKIEIGKVLVQWGVPGAGIVMVTPDHVLWAGGVGKADLTTGSDVTAETMFRAGSISKSFVALALMKLQEQGKIDLDAKLRDIAPEIDTRNPWEATHPVRVAHLLEHTAGFDDWRWAGNVVDDGGRTTPRQVLDLFPGRHQVRWRPGTCMVYSNHGYVLAGYLIEKITGRRFDDYIRDAVLNPLHMYRSRFGRSAANRALLAVGHYRHPPVPMPYRYLLQRPAGDLITSPGEMAGFLQMWLNRGRSGSERVVSADSIARMEEPRTSLAARAGLKAGYGSGNHSFGGSWGRRGHGGQVEGFMGFYAYMPQARLGYAILVNTYASGPGLAFIDKLVFEYLTEPLPKPPQPPSAGKAGDEDLRAYEGIYVPADLRIHPRSLPQFFQRVCRVRAEREGLRQAAVFGRGEARFVPTARSLFRMDGDVEPSLAFAQTERGRMAMAGALGYFERTAAWRPYALAVAVPAVLLIALSTIAYALVWIPARLLGRRVEHLALRAVPLAAVLALTALVVAMLASADDPTARPTVWYCALSWLLPLLSLWGLLVARRSFTYEIKSAVRVHSLLAAVACCGAAVALAHQNLLAVGL